MWMSVREAIIIAITTITVLIQLVVTTVSATMVMREMKTTVVSTHEDIQGVSECVHHIYVCAHINVFLVRDIDTYACVYMCTLFHFSRTMLYV